MNKSREYSKMLQDSILKYSVFSFVNYKDFLKKIYDDCKLQTNGFSYQRYAKILGFEETNIVWLYSIGKRKLTTNSAKKIAKALKFNKQQNTYFQQMVLYNNEVDFEKKEEAFRKMLQLKTKVLGEKSEQLTLEYFSQWYYPIIREMSSLADFRSDEEWIQSRLFFKLKKQQITEALELLEKLGLFSRNQNGQLIRTEKNQISTDRSSKNIALISYHKQICELTRDSVSQVPAKLRDLNTITVCLSDESAQKVRHLIHELCGKIMEIEAQEVKTDRIYQFNLQQIALTKSLDS